MLIQTTIFKCSHCGQPIPDGRSDKRYCSNACKQKNYRWRNKALRYASAIRANATSMAAYLDYPEMRDIAEQEISDAIKFIKDIAREHGLTIKVVK